MKPILFNTQMVQAILSGQKTTTRRIIKRTPANDTSGGYGFWKEFNKNDNKWYIKDYTFSTIWQEEKGYIERHSKYNVGDILYVRETWLAHSRGLRTLAFKYKADGYVNDIVSFDKERFDKFYKFADQEKWQPSLFMPKEAARIFLKVTDVRVERLHDIDYEGCKNEGVKAGYDGWLGEWSSLWDSTVNKKDIDKYGWNANPYVWVIEFLKIDKSDIGMVK